MKFTFNISFILLLILFAFVNYCSTNVAIDTAYETEFSARAIDTASTTNNNNNPSSTAAPTSTTASVDQTIAIYPNALDMNWYSGSLIPSMIHYVLVPAVQAHSASWISDNTRSMIESSRSWASFFQQWAKRFADFFRRVSEMRFEQCTKKLFCTLGRVSARQSRIEKRSTGFQFIELLNNLITLPLFEGRLDRSYSDARQKGATGADCESFLGKEQCPIHSSIMDTTVQFFQNFGF